jgi:uncharacterized protein (DUF1800 family)
MVLGFMRTRIIVFFALASLGRGLPSPAADPLPSALDLAISNRAKTVTWPRPLIPALESNRLLSAQSVTSFVEVASTNIGLAPWGYTYVTSNDFPAQFFAVQLVQKSSNALLAANVLNRLAYGPTPDDLEHVAAIGPQAYIDEQLAPENLANPLDAYTVEYTNAVSLPPTANWTTVTVTGLVSSSVLYVYLTEVGEVNLDDVQLAYNYVLTAVTNTVTLVTNGTDVVTNSLITTNVFTNLTANLVVNGDFEDALGPPWTVSTNLAGSYLDATTFSSGSQSLRMVSSTPGSSQGSSIWQTLPAAPVTTRGTNVVDAQTKIHFTNTVSSLRAILAFSCLPNASSRSLTLRLSGSGLIISGTAPPDAPAWIYVTATGPASTTSNLYVYLSGAGEGYIDDMKLVADAVPGSGTNLLVNGDFEQPLTNGWQTTADFTNSYVDNTVSHSGAGSLHLVATAAGAGSGDSIFQVVSRLTNGLTYTLSYWYRPATSSRTLTARLSGSLLNSTPDTSSGGLKRRLDAADWSVSLTELRNWYCLNAVSDPRQLLEILTQFFENHFVTYQSKTSDYFDRYYDGTVLDRIATDLEYREVARWRRALSNPNCTFYDLLRISAESPAQIVYLDTVGSRGDVAQIANENYARELFELYCMGVDNGYDQFDITVMSRAWTGWTVGIVDRRNIDNPFAPAGGQGSPNPNDASLLQYGYYPGVGYSAVSNIIGVWTFIYNQNWHGTNRAPILSVWDTNSPAANPRALGPKVVPARFGPPWAGQSYQLILPARTGTNGIQDGYDVIKRLSELPFTAEYLSVKLCRVFVHDDFPNPTTRPELPEYAFYDYTNPNRSAEAELVRQCIVAWDTPGPDGRKGNIRAVLRTIFNSELFRSHGGSRQKVKTPLEFLISAARALRSVDASGTATAFTDGGFSDTLIRMGNMSLFNRPDPDGYPEVGPPWVSAGTLAERLRFVQTLCMDPGQTGGRPTDAGNNTVEPVDLLQRKLPANQWTDAGAVADLFLGYLCPGEGRANLDLYRASAVNFLNDGSADPTGNNTSTRRFDQLTVSSSATSSYDLRVRGMVAMLMTLQRFQEQ